MFADMVAFERKFPEKTPWHALSVRFSWIVPKIAISATTTIKTCLLVLAGGFAAQHNRVPLDSDLRTAIFVAVIFFLLFRRTRWLGLALLGFAMFVQAGTAIVESRLDPKFSGDSMLTRVRIADFPESHGATVAMIIEPLDDIRLPDRSRVTWFEPPQQPRIGDIWEFELRLRRPHGSSNPGGFSAEDWMFRKRLHAAGYVVAGKRNRLLDSGVLSPLETYRRDFVARAEAHGGDSAGVLAAIGVGARHLISAGQWTRYAKTGSSHLMAISGLHIGLAAAAALAAFTLLAGVLRFRGTPIDLATKIAIGIATSYAVVSGFAVPAQRATLMLLLAAIAMLLRRRVLLPRVLALAALLVFFTDPIALSAPGFVLSFAAVATLLWLTACYRRPSRLRGLRELCTMQLWLLLGLMPLTALLYQRIAFAAPVVNLMTVPVFSVITVPLTLASMMLQPFWDAASIALLQLAAESAAVIERIITLFAGLPGTDTAVAGVNGRSSGFWLVAILPAAWLLLPRGWPGRSIALIGVVALLLHKPPPPPRNCFAAHILDVGQGLSVVLQTRQRTMLFDTGASYRGGGTAVDKTVAPFLRYLGIRGIDWLVVSHADDDHAGGVTALLQHTGVGEIYAGESLPDIARRVAKCTAGIAWRADGIEFQFLHPAIGSQLSGNNASCVLLVKAGTASLLLSGDIETPAEQRLLARWPLAPARVVVMPHHGSLTSSSPPFVNQLRPDIAIASVGHNNRWGFPHSRVTKRWEGAGATVLDTARSGAISFRLCANDAPVELSQERLRRQRFWHDRGQL